MGQKGLYKTNRLMFGLKTATSKFQRTIEELLSNIEGVIVFVDDIFLFSKTEAVGSHIKIV